jgi:hypothetical protein
MKSATGYMKISKFLRSFGGSKELPASVQNVPEQAEVSRSATPAIVQTRRPRLKSASVANGLGDFQSVSHPAGINLYLQPAPAAHQPTQLGKDAPLSAVFSRLLAQPAASTLPEQNLRSMLRFVK